MNKKMSLSFARVFTLILMSVFLLSGCVLSGPRGGYVERQIDLPDYGSWEAGNEKRCGENIISKSFIYDGDKYRNRFRLMREFSWVDGNQSEPIMYLEGYGNISDFENLKESYSLTYELVAYKNLQENWLGRDDLPTHSREVAAKFIQGASEKAVFYALYKKKPEDVPSGKFFKEIESEVERMVNMMFGSECSSRRL